MLYITAFFVAIVIILSFIGERSTVIESSAQSFRFALS